MRDPNRIDRIINLLRQAWHMVPDQRLGQLMENLLYTKDSPQPIWTIEDDVTARKLLAFIGGGFAASEETK